jgi:hypothetical protein
VVQFVLLLGSYGDFLQKNSLRDYYVYFWFSVIFVNLVWHAFLLLFLMVKIEISQSEYVLVVFIAFEFGFLILENGVMISKFRCKLPYRVGLNQ